MQLTAQGKEAFVSFLRTQYPTPQFTWLEEKGEEDGVCYTAYRITGKSVECQAVIYYMPGNPEHYYAALLNTPENGKDD